MLSELIQKASEDNAVKHSLGLDGEIEVQDHTNLGDDSNTNLARAMQDLRLQQNAKRDPREQSPYRHRGTADQFCILKSNDDRSRRAVVAIEYKAPYKLTPHTVGAGLKTEIEIYKDFISQNQELDNDKEKENWRCRYVMAAVVTQLLTFMVTLSTRSGICIPTHRRRSEQRLLQCPHSHP